MRDTTLIQVDSQLVVTVDSSTTLEDLTDEIKYYLRKMGQNIIEIGKRLTLAKEKLPHGEWQNWLEDNFNLSIPTARKFMQISDRFGIPRIDARFGSTQMIQMLSLPEGEEEKFIAEKEAEGMPVQDMSVKQLRAEIKKYKAKLAKVSKGSESLVSVKQAANDSTVVEESVQVENALSVESAEESAAVTGSDTGVGTDAVKVLSISNEDQCGGQNLLEQFLCMMQKLATGGNLKELVEQSAEKDLQALEKQLKQFSELYGDLRAHLTQWKSGKDTLDDSLAERFGNVHSNAHLNQTQTVEETAEAVEEDKGGDNEDSLEVIVEKVCDKTEVDESDRHSIISALYQIALNDDENFTRTEYIGELMEGKGFEVVPQMSTRDLYNVLYQVALKFKIARNLSKRVESFQT